MKSNTAPSTLPKMKARRGNTLFRNCLLIGLIAGSAIAQTVPDLTNGGVPSTNNSTNLGPTGMRGWMYHNVTDSSLSRQIKVYTVDAGSPAAGILAADDVILGASGTAAVPTNFTYDARRSFADAINDAEARTPATLKILRWRAGLTDTVEITLQTMGAYSATAPYNCPKSALIRQHGLAAIMAGETSGLYNLGALSLLAAYDPADPNNAARMARAEAEVLALIPNQQSLDLMLTATGLDAGSTWERGHTLILFCEYFLLTGDTRVLPAIRSFAVLIARNQTLFGTMSHKFSDPWPDGSLNGPMGAGYGPVNSAAMPCWLGLLLAKQCGLTDPEIDPAVERASRFYAYYTDKGVIPYGEHTPYVGYYESNGKMALAALAFGLQPNRAAEARHYTRMAVTASREREIGHTGAFFHYLWAPLGAAAGGEEAAAFHFAEIRWMLDLNRSWNGRFIYDCLNGEGPKNGEQYGIGADGIRFRMSTAALLTYALPLRNLHITGKNHDPARWLTPAELADSETALEYQAAGRTVSELISDLGNWSSVVRRKAADQLLTFPPTSTTISQLTAIATDTNANRGARVEACYVLGNIADEATAGARATTLVGLLTDPENHVRYMSADAMRSISNGYRLPHLNTILAAAASTAKPLLPLDEEDPLHMAHCRLSVLLFQNGGVASGANVNLAPKHLLYPAIKAAAANPIGQARGSLSSIYNFLSEEDMRVISGSVVDAARLRTPADRMSSRSGRSAALEFLKKFDVAEGVPVALAMMRDDGALNARAFTVLNQYAGSSKTVVPDPDVEGYMRELIGNGFEVDSDQQLLDIIAADTNPTPLVPLKSIQSVTADSPSITLPSLWTTLRVVSTDYAEGDSIYTWRKIHGAGNVTFAPNGTTASENAVALFDGTPGQYLFEVTMTDSRGLTQVSSTITVTLNGTGGTLPPNSPPVANNQSPSVLRAIPALITLTGTDPEGYPLTYAIVDAPAHGRLSGDAPNLIYTPDYNYLGADSFTFRVMDSEGQFSPPATVSITISENGGIPAAIYEPFDYTTGNLNEKSGTSEKGLLGTWYTNNTISTVVTPSLSYGILPTLGGTNQNNGTALGGARAISPDALANFGLLDDGATLWFSAMIGIGEGVNTTNSKIRFAFSNSYFNLGNSALLNDGAQPGSGLGLFVGRFGDWNGRFAATQFRDSSFGTLDAPNIYGTTASYLTRIGAGQHKFVVGKIQWGASQDVIELYFPDEDMNLGPVQSSLNADVDQSTFDTLTWNSIGVALVDEIRVGPTYHSVLAGNAPMAADTTAPGPGPMAFHQAPTPISPSAIRMEAMPVLDTSGVEYYFTCTAGGGNDSGWQSSPIYTNTGLTPGVLYSYTVKARDNSPALNETAPSTALSATINTQATLPDFSGMTRTTAESIIASLGMNLGTVTLVSDPNLLEDTVTGQSPAGQQTIALGTTVNLTAVGPDITAPNPNPASFASEPAAVDFFSITMTATTGSDPTGVQYLFTEISGNPGGTSSGWQDSPVYTDGGLEDGTQYTYTVTLRDKSPNANVTSPSAPASVTTPALPDPIIAYWDGGYGSWGDVTKWSTVSGATTPDPATVPDFVDTAIFNTTSGGSTLQEVALDGNRSISSLIYRSGTPHIVANTSGTIPRTLAIGGGGITINNTVGGNFEIGRSASTLGAVNIALTADQSWTNNDNNSMAVNGSISGDFQLTKSGTGSLHLNGANSYTGGLVINAGSVSSTITFNDSFLGSAFNAQVTVNTGGTLSLNRNNITGTLTMNGGNVTSSNGFGSTWNGSIILQSTSLFMNGGAGSVTVNAVISGPGGFSRTAAGNDTRVILKSANTFTGDTVWAVANARFELDHSLALQNSTLNTASSLVSSGSVERGFRTTVSSLTLGGLSGNKDLKSLFATNATAGGYNNLISLTLNPGLGKTPTYSGGIANGATAMTLTKTGLGTQTLSGTNTYTGTTTISQGTLALLGGSLASPITVASDASLGFTLGSPTISSSSVNFGAGTVAITGMPTLASYTLMTATGGFTGTPVLSYPIPGYALTVDGNELKLIVFQANNAPVWAGNPVIEINATEDAPYSATLADDAFDSDGDPLTFAKISGPAWLSVAPDGTLSGTPTQSNVGPNSFTVSVTDGIDAPVSATLNITVINVNDAPVFFANPINGADATEDEPYTATLAGSATDEDGDPLTYAKVSGSAWLSIAPNGALSGTPTQSDVGANSFTISVSDGIANPVEATLAITVIASSSEVILTIHSDQNLGGTSASIPNTHTIYSAAAIPGSLNNQISSFLLKQGHMAVVATQSDGLGYSKVFIASDADLTVNALPAELDDQISFIRVMPWRNTLKKGLAGGDHTHASQLNGSWYYNWGASLEQGQVLSNHEFVPMSWGHGGTDPDDIIKYRQMDQVTHLLAFNEPDDCNGQSGQWGGMCQVSNAVAYYAPLQQAGLRLGSPVTREGFTWMTDFMTQAEAANLRVDTVALHWYDWGSSPATNTTPTPEQVFNRFKAHLSNAYARYRRPLWITEFNANPNRSREIQDGFLQLALPYLEECGYVERYSYFEPNGGNGSFRDAQGGLTSTGLIYRDHASSIAYHSGELPATWQTSDVGQVAAAGAALHVNNIFTVSGTGAGITGTADAFRYVYQPVSGDVTITARINSLVWRNNESRGGVMIRNDLSAGSPHALMAITASNGAKLVSRAALNGSTTTTTNTGVSAPGWVRMVRAGNTLTGYRSADGVSWTLVGTRTIAMNETVYVGLAVSSHNDGATAFNDVIFSQVSLGTASTPPTLAGSGIVDNVSGGSVIENTLVTYTVNFSKDMDDSTVDASDFGNAGTAPVSIGTVTEISPGVFTVQATPTAPGTLQLQVNPGSVLNDTEGNPLDTTAAILDDTVITVLMANVAPAWASNPVNKADATQDTAYSATLADDASDANSDPLTFAKVSGPAWLSVAPNGALTGTPTQSDVGANAFTVSVSDGIAAPVEAALNITVINVNNVPVWASNPITGADATKGVSYTATLAGSATDADGDPLTFAKVSGPAWLSVAANGSLTGTPTSGDVGLNSFTVSVSDGIAAPVEATLNITVVNTNSPPVFLTNPIIAADASEGTAYTGVTIAGQATDPDAGDIITFSKVSGPAWLVVSPDGALSGTPPAGSTGLNSFIVRATDSASATADATLEITVTGLPLPWVSSDIGTGMLAGSASFDAGTFTQAGSGVIGGTSDKLRFTYQTLTGDGEITARITNLQNTGNSSRIGVMIRDSLAANSKQIFMGMTGSNAYRWVRRTATGGKTTSSNSSTGTVPDTWVRLVRSGNTITAYKSTNGTSWTSVGSTTNTSFAATCFIGLAAGSGSDTTLNTSQFSNVSVTP